MEAGFQLKKATLYKTLFKVLLSTENWFYMMRYHNGKGYKSQLYL